MFVSLFHPFRYGGERTWVHCGRGRFDRTEDYLNRKQKGAKSEVVQPLEETETCLQVMQACCTIPTTFRQLPSIVGRTSSETRFVRWVAYVWIVSDGDVKGGFIKCLREETRPWPPAADGPCTDHLLRSRAYRSAACVSSNVNVT